MSSAKPDAQAFVADLQALVEKSQGIEDAQSAHVAFVKGLVDVITKPQHTDLFFSQFAPVTSPFKTVSAIISSSLGTLEYPRTYVKRENPLTRIKEDVEIGSVHVGLVLARPKLDEKPRLCIVASGLLAVDKREDLEIKMDAADKYTTHQDRQEWRFHRLIDPQLEEEFVTVNGYDGPHYLLELSAESVADNPAVLNALLKGIMQTTAGGRRTGESAQQVARFIENMYAVTSHYRQQLEDNWMRVAE